MAIELVREERHHGHGAPRWRGRGRVARILRDLLWQQPPVRVGVTHTRPHAVLSEPCEAPACALPRPPRRPCACTARWSCCRHCLRQRPSPCRPRLAPARPRRAEEAVRNAVCTQGEAARSCSLEGAGCNLNRAWRRGCRAERRRSARLAGLRARCLCGLGGSSEDEGRD